MTGDLVIGLDSSTTATKAIAWDRDGRAVAEGRAADRLVQPAGRLVRAGRRRLVGFGRHGAAASSLARSTPERIAAIAISNQRESFAQFDAEGKALRPGTLWLDERGRCRSRAHGRVDRARRASIASPASRSM